MKGLGRVSNKQEVKNLGWKELFQKYISSGGQGTPVQPCHVAVCDLEKLKFLKTLLLCVQNEQKMVIKQGM